MPNYRKIEIAAERVRKESDALLVLVIRPEWGYVAADSRLTTRDAVETLRNEIQNIENFLNQKRGGR